MNNKNIVPIAVKNSGCWYHRIELPYSRMGYSPIFERQPLSTSKLYIINRKFPYHTFEEVKKSGVRYILDLDDYWVMGGDHPMYEAYEGQGNRVIIEKYIKAATAVTVTNEQLYNLVKPLNSNVYVIPNSLPFGEGQFKFPNKKQSGKFIYAGSFSHANDVKIVSDVVDSLDVDFYLASRLTGNAHWEEIRSAFKSPIKTIPNKNISTYMYIYDDKNVSLVPVVDNLFSNCKSNLKVIEAGCKGLHVIASKCLPYYNSLDKDFIDFAETKADWYEHIKYCNENEEYVKDRSWLLSNHVREHYSMDKVNKLRAEVIGEVIRKG